MAIYMLMYITVSCAMAFDNVKIRMFLSFCFQMQHPIQMKPADSEKRNGT